VAPARAEWKVYLATDAFVPQFGDEVVVEILDGSSSRPERFLDASSPDRWPISFGVVPADPRTPVRIRARLFRLETTGSDGLPAGTSLIDATAKLPPPDGVTPVALTLAMACFGVAADVQGARSCDAGTGQLAAEPTLSVMTDIPALLAANTWAPAAPVDCKGPVPHGMICVPGGAFLLGSAKHPPISAQYDPVPEHLVQLSPFALDADEFTVGQYRGLVQAGDVPEPVPQGSNYDQGDGWCTYLSIMDGSHDAMPVNCLPWSGAQQACAAVGKRLPTEAEWEFAARNTTRESPFPWGSDPDECAYAVIGRGDYLHFDPINCELQENRFSVGPVAGGSARDKTALGVLNLGGNLTEWLEDLFAPYSAPCWNPAGARLLVDPVCGSDKNGAQIDGSLRGGSWNQVPGMSLSYVRNDESRNNWDIGVGFRCAASM
jgi:formylglycine-generating enzyme required for sulfatase activity